MQSAFGTKILSAFEQAEAEEDVSLHRDLLTFVLVGAGPTGVEMAAALAIFVRTTLRSEFRRIDPTSARIILVDALRQVLGNFAASLSEAAEEHLQKLGVEVHLGHAVEKVDSDGVMIAGERIASKTVIWTAGVAPSPAGKWLGAETDRAGRVRVQHDLTVPGKISVFFQWCWSFLTGQRGSRLIVNYQASELAPITSMLPIGDKSRSSDR